MADPQLSSAATSRPGPGRTVTMLVDPEPTTLLALGNCADPTMLVSGKINEGLLTYDFDLTPRPQLAVEWSADPSGLALRFRLRSGVHWHDGTPFSSRDVAFSVMLLKQLHPRGRSTLANVTKVETPDPLTAVIHLSYPAPALLRALAGAESPMIPQHRYNELPPSAINDIAPVGTGPFIFREWVKGSHVTLERNPRYWGEPRPAIDRLVIRFIDDPAERLAAIEQGAIDIAPATPVSVTVLDSLSRRPRLAFETNGYQYTNQIVRLEFNLDHPIVGTYAVRRAIAHAIDRSALVEQAWLGYGKAAYGPISPDLKPYGNDAPAVPRLDHGAAERWLDVAGFPRRTDGTRLSLPLDFVPAGDGYQRTADAIAAALREIGIAVTVRHQDFAGYVRRLYTERDFAFAVARSNNMFDPSVGVQRIYWSRNFRKGVPFSNGSHYASDDADQLLEHAAIEQNAETRRRLFRSFQTKVIEDLPDVSLLAPAQITIADRSLVGHTVSADGTNGNFADLRFVV